MWLALRKLSRALYSTAVILTDTLTSIRYEPAGAGTQLFVYGLIHLQTCHMMHSFSLMERTYINSSEKLDHSRNTLISLSEIKRWVSV